MHIRNVILQLISIPLQAWVLQAGEAPAAVEIMHRNMGVDFNYTVYAGDEKQARLACEKAASRVDEINTALSDYDHDSELMRLSRNAVATPVQVGNDLYEVLSAALQMSALTEGAFDMSVGPYSLLWRQARHRRRLPDADALRSCAKRVGHHLLSLNKEQRTVQLAQPHMRLDPGGVAKGYALDQAMAVLRDEGLRQVMIRAGGDLIVGSAPPGRKGWILEDALTGKRLLVADRAVATSGDSVQVLNVDGVRYSHIIDPRTGYGVTNRCQAIVIAGRAMDADMRSSSLCVLGSAKGLDLARAQDWTARITVTGEKKKHSSMATADFSKYYFKSE